jgi:hypothetical protein
LVNKKLTMLAVGDTVLNMAEPDKVFDLVTPILKSADVVIGQGEMIFTKRPVATAAWSAVGHPDGQARSCDPQNIRAYKKAGFNIIHLASNHIWDAGIPGVEDTLAGFKDAGIATVGAGMNIDEARKPAIIERGGIRFGFLSYNCVGPKETYANPLKPGCAWVHILACYEVDHPTIGCPPSVYTFAEPNSLKAMAEDVRKLRLVCDVLTVHFHKGIGMTPAKIAMYEQQVSYAAIDAGADLIVAEHAHILKGIETYKGKTIFHGLGNFVTGGGPNILLKGERPDWLKRQEEMRVKESFGLERGPQCPTWPMHPDQNLSVVAKCVIEEAKITRVSYLPCIISSEGTEYEKPEILKNGEQGRRIFDYMEKITREAGLNAEYEWDGDEVLIKSA